MERRPASSDPQKPSKPKHGISNAASTRVKHDFLNLAQKLSGSIIDVVFDQTRGLLTTRLMRAYADNHAFTEADFA